MTAFEFLNFIFPSVAGTPVNVTASRTAPVEVTVIWDAPSPRPDGYEVFYQVDGGDILSGGTTTTNTALTLTGVISGIEFSCFVVAFSDNSLPSARSNVVILQGEIIN